MSIIHYTDIRVNLAVMVGVRKMMNMSTLGQKINN